MLEFVLKSYKLKIISLCEKTGFLLSNPEKSMGLGGWMDGWMGGWVDGWMAGRVGAKSGLRIAYSNQKLKKKSDVRWKI